MKPAASPATAAPSAADVVAYAVDTLLEWMPPYDTAQDRPQDRVTALEVNPGGQLVVRYERVDRSAPDVYKPKRFRIRVTAEEIL